MTVMTLIHVLLTLSKDCRWSGTIHVHVTINVLCHFSFPCRLDCQLWGVALKLMWLLCQKLWQFNLLKFHKYEKPSETQPEILAWQKLHSRQKDAVKFWSCTNHLNINLNKNLPDWKEIKTQSQHRTALTCINLKRAKAGALSFGKMYPRME